MKLMVERTLKELVDDRIKVIEVTSATEAIRFLRSLPRAD